LVVVRADANTIAAAPEEYDAVVFAGHGVPDGSVVARMLAEKRHVLLAGESCVSGDELCSLSTAAQRVGVQFGVLNPDRYLPSRQFIRQHLDAGKLGDVGLVRVHRWQSPTAVGPVGSREPIEALARDLDMTAWLVGRPAERVFAVERSTDAATVGAGRFVQVHFGFPGGAMALMDYSDRLPVGDGYESLSVIGTAGAAYADDHQNMQLIYRGGRPQAVRTDESARQLAAIVQEFVDALGAGRDLTPTVAAWQTVLGVVAAVRRSIESRQAVLLEGR
jgi:predicted dehydrogenase